MYPFLDIFGTQLHMTGIGIIICILTFLRATKRYARFYDIDRSEFGKRVPAYLIVIYFVSQYVWYLIGDFVIIPSTRHQLLSYISPADYTFHLVGIVIAIWWCVRHFLSSIADPHTHVRWIDTRFLSMMRACIPLGFFLLLWDNFIWEPSDGYLSISAFHPESNVARYDTVMPLGLYLSCIALVLLLITKILRARRPQMRGYGFVWWVVFLCMVCLLILFQAYPRHLVFSLIKTRDIKNIALLWAVWVIVWKYFRVYHFYTNLRLHTDQRQ